ncbi:MAG: hypothetical protein KBE23_01980 [Chloroflexi bacterium]|nr:hypothetical protein [Chloroflexota bacterium]MBP7041483.1 hypothetical protein [Chloroflexota bacterium]
MKKLFVLFLLCVFSGLWLQTEQTRGAEPEKLYVWQEYKRNPAIYDVAVGSTYIWGAYPDGVIRWNKQDHTYKTYTFGSEVTAVQIAVNNNVWVGTTNDLYRFDGISWTRYTTDDGLPYNTISSLSVGLQDQLFVGAAGGIVVYNGAQWTQIPTITVDPYHCFSYGGIVDIALDTQNRFWVSMDNAPMCYFDQGIWKIFSQNQSSVSSKDIEFAPNGDMWLAGVYDGAGAQAAARLTTNGTWIAYNTSNGLPDNYSSSLTIDPLGDIWLGFSGGQGVSHFNGSVWSTQNLFSGFYGGAVYDVESDGAGGIWTGGTHVSHLSNNIWNTYLAGLPFAPYNYIRTLYVDSDDNLWAGTESMGVVKFDGQAWLHYTPAHGLGGNIVNAIAEDQNGNMWFGCSHGEFNVVGDGLTRFDGVTWQTFTMADGLADNRISDIAVDNANTIWIAHPYSGVSHKSTSGWTTYTTADGLLSDRVGTILAHDGSIWAGYGTDYVSETGISRFDGATWTTYNESDGLSGAVRDLAVNRNNSLLALTSADVFQLNGNSWSDLAVPSLGMTFWRFAADKDNQIWVTGNGGGAIRFDGAQSYAITPSETGTSALGSKVAANSSGNTLWFSSTEGVVSLRIVDVNARIFLPLAAK